MVQGKRVNAAHVIFTMIPTIPLDFLNFFFFVCVSDYFYSSTGHFYGFVLSGHDGLNQDKI